MERASLYIHIPFCLSKCTYCDFCSYVGVSNYTQSDYIDRLLAEAESRKHELDGRLIDTIYIGGGTPSCLQPGEIARLMSGISAIFDISKATEVSIESNPNSLSYDKIAEYKSCGITRISIGVQTFDNNLLQIIGRSHSCKQAEDAISAAVNSGLDISLDLMVGLPCQTMANVKYDIAKAIEFQVGHISCYSLILEDGTPLSDMVERGDITLPSDDTAADYYDYVALTLQKSGYNRYEVSNFGKPCRHNIAYWELRDYLGLGVAAHSLTDRCRRYNSDNLDDYMLSASSTIDEVLSDKDYCIEMVMLALRMDKGISRELINRYVPSDKSAIFDEIIAKYSQFLVVSSSAISMRGQYIYCMNSIVADIIGELEQLWI